MTTQHNPDEIARLCCGAREIADSLFVRPWETVDAHLRAMADQLEAAQAEIERMPRLQATTVRIATEEAGVRGERFANLQQANSTLTTERDKLRAELERLTRIAHNIVDKYEDCLPLITDQDRDEFSNLRREINALKQDNASLTLGAMDNHSGVVASFHERCGQLTTERDAARREVAEMRPVVDIILLWQREWPGAFASVAPEGVRIAVDAYRAARDKAGGGGGTTRERMTRKRPA